MATRASNRRGDGSALSSLQPWEIRDARFQQSQHLATEGNNGMAKGPSSSLPLQHLEQSNLDEMGERVRLATDGQRGLAADPTHERRGLPHEIKALMVEMFAQFQSVSHISDTLKRDHGLVIDRRTIESFNPDSHHCRIGKRLKSLFNSQREAYIKECAKVAVSHQAHRLRLIGQIVDKATTAKDFGNALKGLELAAKEMGGLSQKVEHTGIVSHVHGSIEDARREVADRLRALVPVIDLQPCNVTEVECNVTGENDGAATVQAMPAKALATRPAPLADSDGTGESAGAGEA
jgi:hypothetical protein